MKVAFPLKDEHELAEDFSKSVLIGVYDDQEETVEYLKPNSQSSLMSSYILSELQKIEDLRCIISPGLSFMALRVLKEYNFDVLQAQGTSIIANIELYHSNSLISLSSMDAFLSDCAGSCSSCKTTCSSH